MDAGQKTLKYLNVMPIDVENFQFQHGELTRQIIGVFYEVYNELGHGFLETVYEEAMSIVLQQAGLRVDRQLPLKVIFRGEIVGDFRADLVVESSVILELKAASGLDPLHEAQLLNYLRATDLEVGLLLNFGPRPPSNAWRIRTDEKAGRR